MSASAFVFAFLHGLRLYFGVCVGEVTYSGEFFQSSDELVKVFIMELRCLSKVEPLVLDLDLVRITR